MNLRKLLNAIGLPLFLLFTFAASAQDRTVTGRVTDTAGRGVPGISVSVKGTSGRGTTTTDDGGFSLSVPSSATTLVFSSVGFATQEVNMAGAASINVTMQPVAGNLNEIVIIGYGTARKRDLTGSVTTVTAKDFNRGVITTPEQLISGKVAGVSITPNDGAPGSGSNITIRGGSSLNASNSPLIVIDGMPLSNSGITGAPNPLTLINPNDIASFTVLKDASAAAIYGSRASNGVIIITTKKGQGGKPRISFTTQLSAGVLARKFDVLSADQFRTLVNTYGSAAQKLMLGTENTDWQDEIYQTAITTDNNISVSGSLNKLPYRFSLGYLNQSGILRTSNLQRVSTGINLSPTLLDGHIKIDFNVKGAFSRTFFANTDAIYGANQFDPTQPVYSGKARYGGYWERLDPLNTNTGLAALSPKNPLGLLMQRSNIGKSQRIIANASIDYKFHFLSDLHAIASGGYDYSKGYGDIVIDDSAAMAYKSFTHPISGTVHGGQRSHYQSNINNYFGNFYLNYTKNLDAKNRIEVMAGTEYQDYLTTNYNFKSYAYDTAVTFTPQFPFDKPQNRIVSFLGRVNYSFNNMVFVTASLRRDGSSRFVANNRWGNFPSAAIAWSLTEMPAFKNSRALSNLRLRFGYGVTGQQDGIGLYDYISYYGLSDDRAQYQFGNTFYQMFRPGGYYENRKWEQTATTNLAVDYGFLNNRISGSIEFYLKKTTDLLNQITQPAFTNFSNTIVANVGSMENKGVEFTINLQPTRNRDVVWDISFNATYNHNEITKLDINETPGYINQIAGIGGLGGVQANAIGHPRSSFYVFKQVYNKDGKPIENLFEDMNRDGILNNNDLYLFQAGMPDWFFGLSSNITYKKFNASFTMRANHGNYLFNNVATNGAISKFLFGSHLSNQSSDVLNTNFYGTGNFYQSDYYVQNASFIKMDNINIGYNLGRIGSNANMRLSAGVQNVFTITKYQGLDPEQGGGIDNNQYPRPRTFLIGVGLDF